MATTPLPSLAAGGGVEEDAGANTGDEAADVRERDLVLVPKWKPSEDMRNTTGLGRAWSAAVWQQQGPRFQVRHSFKDWSPSGICNELERDKAGERHLSAAFGIKAAVFDTQMLQGGGTHFQRTNVGRLHLETLQRGASREIKIDAVDTRELQTREVLGGEGRIVELEGPAGEVGGDSEPELPDIELQHAADPAVAVQLQIEAAGVQIHHIQIEVAGAQARAPAADAQQAVDEGGEANGGRGPPAVAPALGANAREHGVPRRQEREDVVEDVLREVTDSVSPTRHGRRAGGGVEEDVGANTGDEAADVRERDLVLVLKWKPSKDMRNTMGLGRAWSTAVWQQQGPR
ncbi:unnamed protein product [Miscanthus lutarioriparius]|uniref:Uncharacterized protein n=1 Tax=Miscanthus lutarioriparius TaxID=422564 RepID=A0A811QFP2_9POAL|nr:unnamed protein product [Miscanthus lutarioriparius]